MILMILVIKFDFEFDPDSKIFADQYQLTEPACLCIQGSPLKTSLLENKIANASIFPFIEIIFIKLFTASQ